MTPTNTPERTALLSFPDPVDQAWSGVLSLLCRETTVFKVEPDDCKGAIKRMMSPGSPGRVAMVEPGSENATPGRLLSSYVGLAAASCGWHFVVLPRRMPLLSGELQALATQYDLETANRKRENRAAKAMELLCISGESEQPNPSSELLPLIEFDLQRLLWDLMPPPSNSTAFKTLRVLGEQPHVLADLIASDDSTWLTALLAYAHTAIKIYSRLLDAPDGCRFKTLAIAEGRRLVAAFQNISEGPTDVRLGPFFSRIAEVNATILDSRSEQLTEQESAELHQEIRLLIQVIGAFEALKRR